MPAAVAPSGDPPWSVAAGVALFGSRTSASRVGASVAARQVALRRQVAGAERGGGLTAGHHAQREQRFPHVLASSRDYTPTLQ
jgi:hypothetical protein